MFTIKSLFIACGAAAGAIAMPALAGCKAPVPESVVIAGTLKDFRAAASDAADHAATLDSFLDSTYTWRSHARELDDLKADLNRMGQMLARLEDERDVATAVERTAIDRAHFLLRQMAVDTTAAIGYVNDNPNDLFTGSYRKAVSSLATEAEQLDSTLARCAKLERAQAKTKNLEKSLSVAAGE